MSDSFWANDISILFSPDRIHEFFPNKDMTKDEKLNALTRLSFYLGIILSFYHSDQRYLLIFAVTLAFTYFLFRFADNNVTTENKSSEKQIEEIENTCSRPTEDNPFMNFTMYDRITENSDKLPACNIDDPEIKKEIEDYFDNNLYKDVSDVFNKRNSQRQFYTMPSTTVVNDQEGFAKWLYNSPQTCKENSEYCLRYEDIRAKRPVN
jgi:hypothetical protein